MNLCQFFLRCVFPSSIYTIHMTNLILAIVPRHIIENCLND